MNLVVDLRWKTISSTFTASENNVGIMFDYEHNFKSEKCKPCYELIISKYKFWSNLIQQNVSFEQFLKIHSQNVCIFKVLLWSPLIVHVPACKSKTFFQSCIFFNLVYYPPALFPLGSVGMNRHLILKYQILPWAHKDSQYQTKVIWNLSYTIIYHVCHINSGLLTASC